MPNAQIRPSAARGHVQIDWLDSRHTFSFGHYFDPAHMGFGDLRVINEDVVQPSQGFAPHGHRDMEIISYPIAGALAHRDSMGHSDVVRPNEIQFMSAGDGVRHSEMNPSATEAGHFLQIWIQPAQKGGAPRYEKRRFEPREGLTLLVSPEGRDGSVQIGQDADLYRAMLTEGQTLPFTPRRPRVWAQVVRGAVEISGHALVEGDGIAFTDAGPLTLSGHRGPVELLLFDLR